MHDLPFSLSVAPYRLTVVHAGVVPGVPLEDQSLADLCKMRDLVPVGPNGKRRWIASEKAVPGGEAWASKWDGPEHVFFGHDAKRQLQRERSATGLDTGCCYGGALTACVLPPLNELVDTPDGDSRVTLEALQGTLVSIPAFDVYENPSEGP